MNVLSTQNLQKNYGRITAVNQLNLTIEEGSVFGLLGPNGSGKTTTLGMLLDVINPSSGSFEWFEKKPTEVQRKRIGSILEKPNFYPNFSAYKNLLLVCKIKNCAHSRVPEVLEQVGLADRAYDNFKTYSLGMKQRLAIASALLNDPDVLIFDEPTNGLDPAGIADIRQLIIDVAQGGRTIILASHLLDEVQKVCTQFAILKNGNLLFQGDVETSFGDDVKLKIAAREMDRLKSALLQYPGISNLKLEKDKFIVNLSESAHSDEVNKYLADQGIYVNYLEVIKKNLEQQFMEIISKNV